MSLTKIQDLLESAGYVTYELSSQAFSIDIDSIVADLSHEAIFRKSSTLEGYVEVSVSLPPIGPALKDPGTLCYLFNEAEPQLRFRFDRRAERIVVAYTLDPEEFAQRMETLMRVCDGVTQLLVCAVTGLRSVTNDELRLAARLPQGFV